MMIFSIKCLETSQAWAALLLNTYCVVGSQFLLNTYCVVGSQFLLNTYCVVGSQFLSPQSQITLYGTYKPALSFMIMARPDKPMAACSSCELEKLTWADRVVHIINTRRRYTKPHSSANAFAMFRNTVTAG